MGVRYQTFLQGLKLKPNLGTDNDPLQSQHTSCFMKCGHNFIRRFPRFLSLRSSYENLSNFRKLRSCGRLEIEIKIT